MARPLICSITNKVQRLHLIENGLRPRERRQAAVFLLLNKLRAGGGKEGGGYRKGGMYLLSVASNG